MVFHYCRLCDARINGYKNALKHVTDCAKKQNKGDGEIYTILLKDEKTKPGQYFCVVDISSQTQISRLDKYLRDLWCECCNHSSKFQSSNLGELENDAFGEKVMDDLVVKNKDSFVYTYDPDNTPTVVYGSVLNKRDGSMDEDEVLIITRNEPLDYTCCVCGKNADKSSRSSALFYCNKCSALAVDGVEFSEVCNSPRMSKCVYAGDNTPYKEKVVKPSPKKRKKGSDEEDHTEQDSEEEKPKKKRARAPAKKKAAKKVDEDEETEEEEPKAKRTPKKTAQKKKDSKKVQEKPKRSNKKKITKDDEDGEEAPKRSKKSPKKVTQEDEEDEQEEEQPKRTRRKHTHAKKEEETEDDQNSDQTVDDEDE
ncbi:hypothetical protein AKO1_007722 [Acrasis kona]|uniref:Uncharacterized protein n=1 Tax=Acrasis kona TaxID=1008807 RepID=A0AAW2YQ89_9EUKA